MKKVLIVDDEESIVTLLKYNLEKEGYETDIAYDGETALKKAEEERFTVILLDLMLPKMDGFEVCKNLRQNKNYTPIIMLTAKDELYDKVLGLEFGADDYLTKPFSPKEVIARIRAIVRRIEIPVEKIEKDIRIGKITIYPEKYEVEVDGQIVFFTRKEFELLLYLAQHKGSVLSRDRLLNAVWNYDFAGDTRIVDVHISRLREKIEENTRTPIYIKTIRGLGYKMEDPS